MPRPSITVRKLACTKAVLITPGDVPVIKPGFITGTSGGAIGTALAQQHLRSVMLGLGMILLGGEAYITNKPNLIDDQGNITDETTQKFLQGFVDRFAVLVTKLKA